MAAAAGRARERLVPPEVLAQLANLELVARTAVDGSLTGLHRSPRFGFSQEFAEYRAYVPGDDLRFVDWNVFGRSDRLFVKRFFGDTNTSLMVLLDSSASMGVGLEELEPPGRVSKLDYGRFLAASLACLAARQHDAAGLLLFGDAVHVHLPPSPRALALQRLYHALDEVEAAGDATLPEAVDQLVGQLRGRSLLVLISDCYVEAQALAGGLGKLRARGHDLLLVHLLTPEEHAPPATAPMTLRDAETGRDLSVDGSELAGGYRERVAGHIAQLRSVTLAAGGHYLQIDTDEPLDGPLLRYLKFRARHP
jgi:uncharacterized protein (DUF58 family)